MEVAAFDVRDAVAALRARSDVRVVINCAGPFVETFSRMVEACIETGKHYTDITGEVDVFEAARSVDEAARAAGVVVMPGVGFDVVPTDCLAVHLKQRLPSATRLRLAFHSVGGGSSGGTTRTMLNALAARRGGLERRDGVIRAVPVAVEQPVVDHGYGVGPVRSSLIGWGDVSTAHASTRIGNIRVYLGTPGVAGFVFWLLSFSLVAWLLSTRAVQAVARALVPAWGPSEAARSRSFTCVWGEASDDDGRRVVSRLRVANGYTFTALAAVRVAENLVYRLPRRPAGSGARPKSGFLTPGMAYGADLVLSCEGTTREDVDTEAA